MTISYTLDVAETGAKSAFKLIFRWRGSIWKAVFWELIAWLIAFYTLAIFQRFILPDSWAKDLSRFSKYLVNTKEAFDFIPLEFLLGFFVKFVVDRWSHILNGIGWIDNSAIAFATFIRGDDEATRALRRTLVRYMVLNQTLVLRDISMQVRKRFPALETLEVTGFCSREELAILENIHDPYSRYWIPIQWCYEHLYEARKNDKIESYLLLDRITTEIQEFRQGLSKLLKYDWVPVPLVYPQLVSLAVRIYFFFVCLISRQFFEDGKYNYWFPVSTVIEFVIYIGWLKVAEVLLNPLGEDDDDLECNYIIDKNLITGMTIVDQGGSASPIILKDKFWDDNHIAPLYSMEAAKRNVHPLIGSVSKVNLVKNTEKVTMIPHKLKLAKMNEDEKNDHLKTVDISDHNKKHIQMRKLSKETNPDKILTLMRQRSHISEVPLNFASSLNNGKENNF